MHLARRAASVGIVSGGVPIGPAEIMPCPACGTEHEKADEVLCRCGARLNVLVPLFAAMAQPFGWRWAALCTVCGEKCTDVEVAHSVGMLHAITCGACAGEED